MCYAQKYKKIIKSELSHKSQSKMNKLYIQTGFVIFVIIINYVTTNNSQLLSSITEDIIDHKTNQLILKIEDQYLNCSCDYQTIKTEIINELKADLKSLIKMEIDESLRIKANAFKHCRKSKFLINSEGNYLKSLCLVQKYSSYDDAEKFCSEHGMNLLIFENEFVYKELKLFLFESNLAMNNIWDQLNGLWINGRFNGTDWSVYKNYQRQAIGNGIAITTEHHRAGNCAVLKRNERFELRNYDCSAGRYHFICEYDSVL